MDRIVWVNWVDPVVCDNWVIRVNLVVQIIWIDRVDWAICGDWPDWVIWVDWVVCYTIFLKKIELNVSYYFTYHGHIWGRMVPVIIMTKKYLTFRVIIPNTFFLYAARYIWTGPSYKMCELNVTYSRSHMVKKGAS